MSKFNLAKKGNYFIPATQDDQVKAYKVGQGEVVQCKSVDQRNIKFHRKFFALINVAWDNLPESMDEHFPTPEHLRKELTKRAGFYETYTDFKGNVQHIPQSIAFAKMKPEEFDDLYNRVLDVVIKHILPDSDRELIETMIANFG